MKTVLMLIVLLAFNISAVLAQTQPRSATVYRCGKDGRDLRDAPCPADPKTSGTQVPYDAPDKAQQQEARERAAADARQAEAMEKDRLRREAEERKRAGAAARLGAPPAAAAASAPKNIVARSPKPRHAHKPPKAASSPR